MDTDKVRGLASVDKSGETDRNIPVGVKDQWYGWLLAMGPLSNTRMSYAH